jgi:hypothetical protein
LEVVLGAVDSQDYNGLCHLLQHVWMMYLYHIAHGIKTQHNSTPKDTEERFVALGTAKMMVVACFKEMSK